MLHLCDKKYVPLSNIMSVPIACMHATSLENVQIHACYMHVVGLVNMPSEVGVVRKGMEDRAE